MSALPHGVYEDLVTEALGARLAQTPAELVERRHLTSGDARDVLTRHIATLADRALASVAGSDDAGVQRQVELTNRISAAIAELAPTAAGTDDVVAATRDLLLAIAPAAVMGEVRFPARPATALSASALLVNGVNQPRIGHEVVTEFASADDVDLLCAFITWSGVRILESAVEGLRARGGRLRVITTTYIGATQKQAVDWLVARGAEVRISYDTRSTRLHAKAWLFRRRSGLSTAYVGSSNLSKVALVDGLEWNVRLSNVEQAHLLRTFADTFENYWEDPSFEPYDPVRDADRLRDSLAAVRGGPTDLPLTVTSLDVRPWSYQETILEQLSAQRVEHDQWKNLVVMATGTGKTVVAGLDYRRLREEGRVQRLLFVAHRDEILTQSRSTFRQILRDGEFGERWVGGERPERWEHVFASVQSLATARLDDLPPDRFDMVIIDEFHHAAAATYRRLLEHLTPTVLVGLTATPERSDGLDVTRWFGSAPPVELRLREALEKGILAPFQYFGIHDDVALDQITFTGGRYDIAELDNVYTGNDRRVALVLQAVTDTIGDPGRMRALGFCVSVAHAEFMARRFTEAGIPSVAVTAGTGTADRRGAVRRLIDREVNVLFTVDLFNEGVDIPVVDTVLFLRPTESATVFLQQLGRGLRHAQGKAMLTVLDFIGAQHEKFRFDVRYRALTGASRRGVARDVVQGFPSLPAGCHIELDRVAAGIVLANITRSLQLRWGGLAQELASSGPETTLATFLGETGLAPQDLYRGGQGGWTALRRRAGLPTPAAGASDTALGRAFGRLLHIDDHERLGFLRAVLAGSSPGGLPVSGGLRQERLAAMVSCAVGGTAASRSDVEATLARLLADRARRDELEQLVDVLRERIGRVTSVGGADIDVPLHVHARYSRNEALAAFGVPNPGTVREGVKWVEAARADVFFVTLNKSEAHYSPTTMYADFAISPRLFHWESQNVTTPASPTGQRYVHHERLGSTVHLFLREDRTPDGGLGAPAYLYAGPMAYRSHEGERPMQIRWELDVALPADVFRAAKVATG